MVLVFGRELESTMVDNQADHHKEVKPSYLGQLISDHR